MIVFFPYHGYLDDVNETASKATGGLYARLIGEDSGLFQSSESLAGKSVRKNVMTPNGDLPWSTSVQSRDGLAWGMLIHQSSHRVGVLFPEGFPFACSVLSSVKENLLTLTSRLTSCLPSS